jgi:hypothetical protein
VDVEVMGFGFPIFLIFMAIMIWNFGLLDYFIPNAPPMFSTVIIVGMILLALIGIVLDISIVGDYEIKKPKSSSGQNLSYNKRTYSDDDDKRFKPKPIDEKQRKGGNHLG